MLTALIQATSQIWMSRNLQLSKKEVALRFMLKPTSLKALWQKTTLTITNGYLDNSEVKEFC